MPVFHTKFMPILANYVHLSKCEISAKFCIFQQIHAYFGYFHKFHAYLGIRAYFEGILQQIHAYFGYLLQFTSRR